MRPTNPNYVVKNRGMDSNRSEFKELHSSSFFDSDLSRPVYRSLTSDSPSDILPGPSKLPVYRSTSSSSDLFPPPSKLTSTSSSKSPFSSSKSYPFVPQNPRSLIDDSYPSSALSKDLPKEPPPVPGGYLEPCTHMISRNKPSTLLDTILQAILSLIKQRAINYPIDTEVVHRKYKVKCVGYPLGEAKVPFVCRVWSMDPDDQGKRYALEFQRRSGCVIQFSEVWRNCKQYFQGTGLFLTDKHSHRSNPPPKLAMQATDTQVRETLKCLYQMATSSCCEVKSQALAVLCKMSNESEQYQSLMIEEEGYLEAFITAANCPNEDVHRCAISLLANLSQNRINTCKKIAEKNGVERLCTLSSSSSKEIVRESLRALLLLAQTLGSRILDDGCHRAIELHRKSQDPFTQEAIQSLAQLAV